MPEQQLDTTRSDYDLFRMSPMEQVHEGMSVLDAHGARLGKVKRLRMGDPDAVTTGNTGDAITVAVAPASNAGGTTGFAGTVPATEPVDEPDVPDPLRTRLRRLGFIELEDSELRGADAYISGDRISHVEDDVVHLRAQDSAAGQQVSQLGSVPDDASPRRFEVTRERLAMTAGGGLALASISGVVGAWQYRQWQSRQRRLDARAKRWATSVGDGLSERNPRTVAGVGAGVGSALMLAAVSQMLARRSPPAETTTTTLSEIASEAQERTSVIPRAALGGAGAVLLLGVLLVRRLSQRDHNPTYIGTPGVESASGRDRVGSGELPPEYGSEQGRR